MCAHQLRDSGHFRGSPGLLPLATPHFLSCHPTSFQPQLHLLFPSKAWERDRQVHAHHHLVQCSSVGLGFAEIPVGYLCHTPSKARRRKEGWICLQESEGSSPFSPPSEFSYQVSTQVEAELRLLLKVSRGEVFICSLHFIIFCSGICSSQTAFIWHTVIHFSAEYLPLYFTLSILRRGTHKIFLSYTDFSSLPMCQSISQ